MSDCYDLMIIRDPMLLDGAMNGDAFFAYVEHVLAPELQPGDLVAMGNLRVHVTAYGSETGGKDDNRYGRTARHHIPRG